MGQVTKQVHGGDVYSLARQLGRSEDSITDFSANINPLGISPRALKALEKALGKLDRYPDPQATWLKERLAAYHRILPGCLLVGNGSTELIYLLPRVLKPRRVLIVSPTFSEYERACHLAGAKSIHLRLRPRNDFRLDPDAICRHFRKGMDMVFLCNPNNPTGQMLSRDEMHWLVIQAARRSIWMVLDEAFIEYQPDQSVLGGLNRAVRPSNLVVLRSFTKFFALSGLRVGYLVAPLSLVRKIQAAREPWTVNSLAQIAAGESLLDAVYIKESMRFMETERPRWLSDFSSLPGVKIFPSQANFFLLRLDQKQIAQKLFKSLAQEGLLLRSCASFKGLGPQYLRIAIKSREDNQRLCQAMRKHLVE